MALFDSLNKMAKNLGEMAEDAMENGKLNIKIMEEKAKLSEAYAQLGEVMYQQAKTGEDKSIPINDLLLKIDGHHQAIEAAQAQTQANQAPAVQPAPAYGSAPAYAPPVQQPVCEAPAPAVPPAAEAVPVTPEVPAEAVCEETVPAADVQPEPVPEPAPEDPVPVEEPAAPAPEPAPAPSAGAKFCGGCGARLDVGARFCGSCGTPVA